MSEVQSVFRAAVPQLEEAFHSQADNVCQGDADKDGKHERPIWDLHDFTDGSSSSVLALNQIQFLCNKVGVNVPDTIIEV